jgi:glucarate dehydratase
MTVTSKPVTSNPVTGRPIRITGVTITPVAFKDPPLLNSVGVHEPFALRAIIEVRTDAGITGLGETYADAVHLERLTAAGKAITGSDVFALQEILATINALVGRNAAGGSGVAGMITTASATDRVFSPFEVACLDIQGKAAGRPVSDLLGGKVRDAVPFSGYLFYKWAVHPGKTAEETGDDWGEALDPDGIVAQARRMVDGYGFTALKLKGGVFAPAEEIEAIRALAAEFPDLSLRLDPNAAWTPATSNHVARELDGVLEYLEDPTPGLEGMADVAKTAPMPLATNMCVVAFDQLEPAVRLRSVGVILSDHHYWGGLTRAKLLAGICENFGIGLSMHSNSHLGISLAAMVHIAGATPNLTYACDTHWPWKTEDVIRESLTFQDGAVTIPTGPGLGVELDEDALAALHEQFLRCGQVNRDDTAYLRRFRPDFDPSVPRW